MSAHEDVETHDALAGGWRIKQLAAGHRYNTDDVLTALRAVEARPHARRVLDLGCGVGSIGLLMLRALPAASLLGVEVQAVSCGLLRWTVASLGLEARVEVREGDLRDEALFADDDERFDIVTANPPYLSPGTARVSPHPQRAAARFELHGDVFDYCRVAARRLAPGGVLCLCHAAADPRPPSAVEAAGLAVRERRDVIFRRGKLPTVAIYVCEHGGADARPEARPEPLVIREVSGERSAAYEEVLARYARRL